MSPRPVAAAAIVDSLDHPTKLLAAQRAYPKALRGLFELPGGKIEPGEDPREALQREIREELGTHLRVGPVISPPGTKVPTPWPILQGRHMWVWLCEVAPGSPPPLAGDSHTELVWVPLENVAELPWLPTNLPIVIDTQRGILKGWDSNEEKRSSPDEAGF